MPGLSDSFRLLRLLCSHQTHITEMPARRFPRTNHTHRRHVLLLHYSAALGAQCLRHCVAGPIMFERDTGKPLNPRGRTGMSNRGLLGRWGPNLAVDPIVTRFEPGSRKLQMLATRRKGASHTWGSTGSLVSDPSGDQCFETTIQEVVHRALGYLEQDALTQRLIEWLLRDEGHTIYRGCAACHSVQHLEAGVHPAASNSVQV